MQERAGLVTMKGNPLTLMGSELRVGNKAPDFIALDNDMSQVSLESFRGKVCIISSVPSCLISIFFVSLATSFKCSSN